MAISLFNLPDDGNYGLTLIASAQTRECGNLHLPKRQADFEFTGQVVELTPEFRRALWRCLPHAPESERLVGTPEPADALIHTMLAHGGAFEGATFRGV